jgi:hypothetical protein
MKLWWIRWLLTGLNLGVMVGVLILAARMQHTKSDCIRTLTLAQKRVDEMYAAKKDAEATLQEARSVRDLVLRENPCIAK